MVNIQFSKDINACGMKVPQGDVPHWWGGEETT